ncbi:transporter substrate-binding domain-containing protein [Streptomyces sp. BE230]|uniref:transporter substrate-binding domain-containing protein n=1 Tax=Streptomyces sp. BE230 TaxID=3002526 RepID=UPI002ED6B019|nr:transporter substrate-binding domain-containing protein [Streptomyces sp. BE230]
MTTTGEGRGRPRRLLDPHNSHGEAIAWALAILMDLSGKTQRAIASESGYSKSAVSRVTDSQLTGSHNAVRGYVKACGEPAEPWVRLYKLAKEVTRSPEKAEEFAQALAELCAESLEEEHVQRLGSVRDLVSAWLASPATDDASGENPAQSPRASQDQTVPSTTTGRVVGERPPGSHHGEPGDANGPGPGEAGTHTPSTTGGTPFTLGRKGRTGSSGADTRRKKPFRRSGQHAVLTGGIACVTLLVAVSVWQLRDHTDTDGVPHRSPTPSSSSTSFSPTINQAVNAELMERLKEAQEGKRKWLIGVKDGQPGLSEKKGKNWVGVEIEFAKIITAALGVDVENISWVPAGTNLRPSLLDSKEVDMFVGTYGMSPERERGARGVPAVAFAGPYFQTTQKVMLRKDKGEPKLANFRKESKLVQSIDDVPLGARVCVVKGSSADVYLEKEGKFSNRARVSDYNICVEGLKVSDPVTSSYDAVITDAVILDGFMELHSGEYMIARDRLIGKPEEYGIGLNRNATDLKIEICQAMKTKKVMDETKKIYENLTGGKPVTQGVCPQS